MLEKMRTEIARKFFEHGFGNTKVCYEVLQIIDKYAEREPKTVNGITFNELKAKIEDWPNMFSDGKTNFIPVRDVLDLIDGAADPKENVIHEIWSRIHQLATSPVEDWSYEFDIGFNNGAEAALKIVEEYEKEGRDKG